MTTAEDYRVRGGGGGLGVGLWGIVAVVAFSTFTPAHADAEPNDSAFRVWFEQQRAAPTALPPDAHKAAVRYRYVFVAGFLNEGFRPGYFNENRNALLDEGVKSDDIHIIFPNSGGGIEENVAFLRRVIPDLAAKGPQKLVLVAHSKGAVEVLAFALSALAFVQDRVQAVFLIQGAFGGSGIADFITGSGHPLDERLPVRWRTELAITARGGKMLDAWIDSGFQSLTHERAEALWRRLVPSAGGPDIASLLVPGMAGKIFFVRAHRVPEKVSGLLSASAFYLSAYYSENDGMVEVTDQWIRGTGKVIATLDADHFALVVARPVSDQPSSTRRAFTRALLMQLSGAFD